MYKQGPSVSLAEIVVLNVDGSSPSGHPKRRHRQKAMSFFVLEYKESCPLMDAALLILFTF